MEKIRRILILCILLVVSASGCSLNGPFRPRSPARVDDPNLTIGEQERLGRERLALPDESAGPFSGAARPGLSAYP